MNHSTEHIIIKNEQSKILNYVYSNYINKLDKNKKFDYYASTIPFFQSFIEDIYISKLIDKNDILKTYDNKSIRIESTSSIDQNKTNERFLNALKENSRIFIDTLRHTDFEDGEDNDVIRQVKKYLEENSYATYLWLHYLYSNNQDDNVVITGILRIIGTLDIKNDTDLLMPMAIAGLNYNSSDAQEAAIMVMENWRSKHCLEALKNTKFASDWMKEYATIVMKELEAELE